MWWIAVFTIVFFILLNGVRIDIKFITIKVWFNDQPEVKHSLLAFAFLCLKRKNFEAFRKTLGLIWVFIRNISVDITLS